ncbi:MAG TPA: hypothetical protein VFV49_15540 [Thermoanaerobaculia bacterium]|nr:hypothetical protein [Thermoanaerobaculia bacterium]
MLRKSFGLALLVVVLSSSSAFAAANQEGRAERLRGRDTERPFIVKVIRFVKGIRGVVSNSYLLGDPRP